MSIDSTQDPDRPKITTLLADIAADAHKMVEQQIAMAKAEMTAEYAKAKQVIVLAVVGSALAIETFVLVCLALAHAIHAFAPDTPWWAIYGFMALLTAAAGTALFAYVRRRAASINVTPERTLETVKESMSWTQS